MTGKERNEMVKEWLKGLKPGDEVCITNTYNVAGLLGELFGAIGNSQKPYDRDVTIITTVRGVLPDGCIVVDDNIYNQDGKLSTGGSDVNMEPSLHPVNDKLRERAQRYDFINTIKKINWEMFSTDSMNRITEIILEECERIQKAKNKKEESE